ncbi:MAG: NAD(P)/FAD-dependent oxidoreductase [Bacteroidetes bacterium]|nr:NAD(P)/FAD-dependent oxidoreductase [Bacteroidota bacterium]
MSNKKHAVVIGAGPAGLTAAYELLSRSEDYEVTILESSNYMGGISRTVNYKGNRMDIGGHRFFSKSDRVMQWWLSMMPIEKGASHAHIHYHGQATEVAGNEANPDKTNLVMLLRNRLSRIYFLGKFFSYPVSLNLQTLRNLGVVRVFNIVFSYAKIRLFPRKPEITLEDFIINRFGKELYHTFFKDYTEKVWGFKCHEISKDWGAQRVKGLSVSKAMVHAVRQMFRRKKPLDIGQKTTETSLIEKFLYPKLGPGQMWERVAEKVQEMGGRILTEHAVVKLDGSSLQITSVWAKTSHGEVVEFQSDLVFSTMPVKDLFEAFSFETDSTVKSIATTLPYRDFITVGLLCKKLKPGTLKDNWIYIQERGVNIGRLQIFNNWSPYLVADAKTTWLGLEYFCNEGDALWSLTDEAFKAMAIAEMEQIGLLDAGDVLDSTLIRMPKTYPAYTGSYSEFSRVIACLNQMQNLYPIGRNGMHKYNNSDHSMLTAMTAVDNILAGNSNKDNLWQINTEEEYHEAKSE